MPTTIPNRIARVRALKPAPVFQPGGNLGQIPGFSLVVADVGVGAQHLHEPLQGIASLGKPRRPVAALGSVKGGKMKPMMWTMEF